MAYYERRAFRTGNHLVTARARSEVYSAHVAALGAARPRIDNRPPRAYSHLARNAKKAQMMEERYTQIERDNLHLLGRMHEILHAPPPWSATMENPPGPRSLNIRVRVRELVRIMADNAAILARIQSVSPILDAAALRQEAELQSMRARMVSTFASGRRGEHARMYSHTFDLSHPEGDERRYSHSSRPASAMPGRSRSPHMGEAAAARDEAETRRLDAEAPDTRHAEQPAPRRLRPASAGPRVASSGRPPSARHLAAIEATRTHTHTHTHAHAQGHEETRGAPDARVPAATAADESRGFTARSVGQRPRMDEFTTSLPSARSAAGAQASPNMQQPGAAASPARQQHGAADGGHTIVVGGVRLPAPGRAAAQQRPRTAVPSSRAAVSPDGPDAATLRVTGRAASPAKSYTSPYAVTPSLPHVNAAEGGAPSGRVSAHSSLARPASAAYTRRPNGPGGSLLSPLARSAAPQREYSGPASVSSAPPGSARSVTRSPSREAPRAHVSDANVSQTSLQRSPSLTTGSTASVPKDGHQRGRGMQRQPSGAAKVLTSTVAPGPAPAPAVEDEDAALGIQRIDESMSDDRTLAEAPLCAQASSVVPEPTRAVLPNTAPPSTASHSSDVPAAGIPLDELEDHHLEALPRPRSAQGGARGSSAHAVTSAAATAVTASSSATSSGASAPGNTSATAAAVPARPTSARLRPESARRARRPDSAGASGRGSLPLAQDGSAGSLPASAGAPVAPPGVAALTPTMEIASEIASPTESDVGVRSGYIPAPMGASASGYGLSTNSSGSRSLEQPDATRVGLSTVVELDSMAASTVSGMMSHFPSPQLSAVLPAPPATSQEQHEDVTTSAALASADSFVIADDGEEDDGVEEALRRVTAQTGSTPVQSDMQSPSQASLQRGGARPPARMDDEGPSNEDADDASAHYEHLRAQPDEPRGGDGHDDYDGLDADFDV